MLKLNNNDNIIKDNIITKPKLRKNESQLSDKQKINFGFNINESVIDVEQDGYGVCYGFDVLYTYGIDPCCGLVLCDENVRMLFHLDGRVTPEDVIEITDKINFSSNTRVIVIPGGSCGINGSFEYKSIEEYYRKKGYEVIEQRIPATFGFVTLDFEKVTIGTGVDRNLDVVLSIPKKNMQTQSYELPDDIEKLVDLKSKLLGDDNYNKSKI